MPVSPTTGNGNSCGAGPLPNTTSHYLVGSAAYGQYQQFGSDGSSALKRTGHQSLQRHSGGRLRRNELSLGELVGRAPPDMKANGQRSFRHPRNPAGHNRPPQPEKHISKTRIPPGAGCGVTGASGSSGRLSELLKSLGVNLNTLCFPVSLWMHLTN